MRIKRTHVQASLFLLVYLFALTLWTLPFQENRVPYGEWDAISHWELADFTAQRDHTFVYLPSFLDFSYGKDNRFKPHTLWYPPPFHTDMAIVSVFAGDRMVPIYLTNAIFATAIMLSVGFVMFRLFGFLPALLSSFLLSLSMRDILPYLWGQWPERFAYAFIPLVLYCLYRYYLSYTEGERKPVYLYLMAVLLASTMLIHPLAFFHALLGLAVLCLFLLFSTRKLPLSWKHAGIASLLFLALFAVFPYQSGNVIVSFLGDGRGLPEGYDPSLTQRLFQWSLDPELFVGSVPPSYFSFSAMHGLWMLPFLLLGLGVLLVRREHRDIFLMAWLVSLYLVLHRDLIGKFNLIHRSLSATAHIFIPISVVGVLSIPSLLPARAETKQWLRYGIALLVVGLGLYFSFPQAYATLDGAYDSPLVRLNAAQIGASEWVQRNVPEGENVSVMGPPEQLMKKVWWMASYSHRTSHYFEGFLRWETYADERNETIRQHLLNDYLVLDYSDIGRLQDQSLARQWQEFERRQLANHTLIYDRDMIRIYKYGGSSDE